VFPVPVNTQFAELNAPALLLWKVTLPLGGTVLPDKASITVTLHIAGLPTITGLGSQLTVVESVCPVTAGTLTFDT